MEEFFGKVLTTIIPFLLPASIIASWLMNHKQSNSNAEEKGNNGVSSGKSKPIKPQSSRTPTKERVETEAVEAPDASGAIVELADKSDKSGKEEDPYSGMGE